MDTVALAAFARRVVHGVPSSIVPRPNLDFFEAWLDERGRLTPLLADRLAHARAVYAEYNVVIYMAGALTEAAPEEQQRYDILGDLVNGYRLPGARMFGYVPHRYTGPKTNTSATPQEVHDTDLLWSGLVARMQVHCLRPLAHGNGAEAGWASMYGVHALYCSPANKGISRLMLGGFNRPEVLTYFDFVEDCVPRIGYLLDCMQSELLVQTSVC